VIAVAAVCDCVRSAGCDELPPDHRYKADDDLEEHRCDEDRFREILPAFHNTPLGLLMDLAVLKVGGAQRWSRPKRRHFVPAAGVSQGNSLRFSGFWD
jgi:hypothetical protein